MPFSIAKLRRLPRIPRGETRMTAFVVALSIANICYLRLWDALLYHPERHYLAATPDRALDYIAALGGLLVMALIIYLVIMVLWHNHHRGLRALAMLLVLVLFVFPLDFVRRASGLDFEAVSGPLRYLLMGIAVVAFVGSAMIFRQRFYAVLFWCAGIVSPYAAVTISQAVAAAFRAEGSTPERPCEAIRFPDSARGRRVVWILFDEWDQAVLNDKRPAGLQLPQLDAFRRESVVATQAFAPAGATLLSIPALLTGQVITAAVANGATTLQVKTAGSTFFRSFRELPSVADDAALLGKNFTAFGWYHPYGRLFADDANIAAKSFGFPAFQAFRKHDLFSAIGAQLLFLGWPFYGRQVTIELYEQMHAEALRCVADPNRNVIFLHYGPPHLPGIFDARSGSLTVWPTSASASYINNLSLVDRTLGELLAAIDRAGLGESTSVILTSDHWWRSAPWVVAKRANPVPLLIRAAGNHTSRVVSERILTTCLRATVRGLLAGELKTNAQVADFLAEAKLSGEVGYVNAVATTGK